MSLVPFEKPRPEDQLPDPFADGAGRDGRSGFPTAEGEAATDQGAPAEGRAPGDGAAPRLWAVPRPADAPGEPHRRFAPAVGRDRVLPFRRRQKRVPIRRRTPWRRWLRPLLGALAIVGLPVAVVVWFLTSSHFALAEWRIESAERVDAAWVDSRLAAFAGRNLFELDLRQVEQGLDHPWLAGADLRKEFPSRLVVRVIERREVALWRGAKGLSYIDGEGRIIAPFRVEEAPAAGVDLVLVSRRQGPEDVPSRGGIIGGATGGTTDGADAETLRELTARDTTARRAAVALLREIDGLESRLLSGLAEIQVLGGDDFELFTSDLPFPLFVRAGTLETKTRRLEEILPGLMARHGVPTAVDLRFRRRIIVEPSTPAESSAAQVERNR